MSVDLVYISAEFGLPIADPIARFPSGSAATAVAAYTSRALHVEIIPAGQVFLERTALEAGRAAGKVMSPAVPDGAVPISRTDIGASEPKRGSAPPAETCKVPTAALRVPTALARVAPLEVEVLARLAVPISGPTHLCC